MVVDFLSMSSVNFAIPDFCSLISGGQSTLNGRTVNLTNNPVLLD